MANILRHLSKTATTSISNTTTRKPTSIFHHQQLRSISSSFISTKSNFLHEQQKRLYAKKKRRSAENELLEELLEEEEEDAKKPAPVRINYSADVPISLSKLLPSIVKIRAIVSGQGDMPWQREKPEQAGGTGFIIYNEEGLNFTPKQKKKQTESQQAATPTSSVIDGKTYEYSKFRIVTNAHVVADSTMVLVSKYGSSKQYQARVISRSYECDCAIMSVEDFSFYDDVKPLELSFVPKLQDNCYVVGYPSGGQGVCLTKGVVSRVEMIQYNNDGDPFFNRDRLLAIQVDAAVNEGNSGGPCVNSNYEVIGVVFQKSFWYENTGYVIPTEILHHFLKTEDSALALTYQEREKKYNKKFRQPTASYKFPSPLADFETQPCANIAMQRFYGLLNDEKTPLTGVIVTRVNPRSEASKVLQVGDAIVEIDGFKIDNTGEIKVDFSNQPSLVAAESPEKNAEAVHSLSYTYLFQRKYLGDLYNLKILRQGQLMDVSLKADVKQFLVEPATKDSITSYFICAGMLFTNVTNGYDISHDLLESISVYSKSNISKHEKYQFHNWKTMEDEELVVCDRILPHEVNSAYVIDESSITPMQVIKFNGHFIVNLKHLADLVEEEMKKDTQSFLVFELANGYQIIFDKDEAKSANTEILSSFDIRSHKSSDLN